MQLSVKCVGTKYRKHAAYQIGRNAGADAAFEYKLLQSMSSKICRVAGGELVISEDLVINTGNVEVKDDLVCYGDKCDNKNTVLVYDESTGQTCKPGATTTKSTTTATTTTGGAVRHTHNPDSTQPLQRHPQRPLQPNTKNQFGSKNRR